MFWVATSGFRPRRIPSVGVEVLLGIKQVVGDVRRAAFAILRKEFLCHPLGGFLASPSCQRAGVLSQTRWNTTTHSLLCGRW